MKLSWWDLAVRGARARVLDAGFVQRSHSLLQPWQGQTIQTRMDNGSNIPFDQCGGLCLHASRSLGMNQYYHIHTVDYKAV